MIANYTLLGAVVIILGIVLLLIYSRDSKREKFISSYLREDGGKSRKSPKVLDLIDAVIPSSIVMNEGEINEKMINAGYYSFKYSHLYMPIKYIVMALGMIAILILNYQDFELMLVISMLAVWVIVALILPDIILDSKVRHYRLMVSKQLPYVIDLLAMCVQTGMTIEASLIYLSKEIRGFEPKTSLLLERMNDRANVVGLENALDEVYEHIPTTEMRSFVMTLKQSLQYGASIYQTLTVLSADIRQVTMLTVEERIGKLAAKMSVPLIIFIMMPIVILIVAPGVMRMMGKL